MDDGNRWRYTCSNVPLPEPHIAGLVVGTLADVLRPNPLFEDDRTPGGVGGGMIALGLLAIIWCLHAIGEDPIDAPTRLVGTGPYTISRNPMYIGWSLLYLGIAAVRNSTWMFAGFPAVLLATHLQIRREEQLLGARFHDAYREYRRTVPRYL